VPSIPGKWDNRNISTVKSPFLVHLDSKDTFSAAEDAHLKGSVTLEAWKKQMIHDLLDDDELVLYVMCYFDAIDSIQRSSKFQQVECRLTITVYGSVEDTTEVGNWFQQYEVYLQDPLVCHRNVPYYNPHKLSSEDLGTCLTVADVVVQSTSQVQLQDIKGGLDMLDLLSSRQILDEARQPKAILSPLKKHQKQALTFMLRREQGWGIEDGHADVWRKIDNNLGNRLFVNMVSETHQVEEPPQFYGGIIADPMGLGKTLTMIALAANDLEEGISATDQEWNANNDPYVKATLIIIPPPLLGSWEEQLISHVVAGQLTYRCHHGKTRFTDSWEVDEVKIVLTTYHTVSAEWKGGMGTSSSVLFNVKWRRIILDEAHYIRNENSRMARAVCALDARSRWAVTGTPIQNRLSDLATLVKFIRVHPYTDTKQFDADLSRLWKSGEDEKAVKRLQYLSSCLLLRRPKTTISLPPRHDKLCAVEFTNEERVIYDRMRQQAIHSIDNALQNDSSPDITKSGSYYVNALQQIESLRLFCNLGLGYQTRHQKPSSDGVKWNEIAQQCFNMERQRGAVICFCCSSVLELTETLLEDSDTAINTPQLFQCLRFACGECFKKHKKAHQKLACGHKPTCSMATVSVDNNTLEDLPELASAVLPSTASLGSSSKVKALVADIKSLPHGLKSIVFSSWRLTLDIAENALQRAGIRTLRFDGKVSQKDRQAVSVLLYLTEASRAYLMEPHWNPNIEEQALARVHRIGQTREVTTVRLYMRDSFEKQVMEAQDTKKQLAGVLLSPHEGGQLDEKLGSLHKLRSLL
ncbi:WD domain-containing protein, partial [Colletotrichum asianum]